MFDQTFVNTGGPTRKPITVAVSFAVQGLVVGTAMLIPILNPGILHPRIETPVWVHLQPVRKIIRTEISPGIQTSHPSVPRVFVAPTKVPDHLTRIVDTDIGFAVPESLAPIGPSSGSGGTDIFSGVMPSRLPDNPPQVARPKNPDPLSSGPIVVGSGVQAAKLIYGPRPAYPSLARTAHVQGTVRIQAVISVDGSINRLQVMSGPPLLIAAAKDAVSQWRYQATLLNGGAVEVITEIDVIFTLSN